MKEDSHTSHIVLRQSPIVLIAKIILIEFLFFVAYLLSGFLIDYLSLIDRVRLLQTFSIDLVLFLFLLLIQMLLTLNVTLQWAGLEYEIIPGKLILRHGIFSITEESFSLTHIESLSINQNLLGRIFNFGTLNLFSPLNKRDICLPTIQNPHKYKDLLQKNIGTEERKTLLIKKDG